MDEHSITLVCFELCGEKFAFNMEHLVEIVRIHTTDIQPCISPIPLIRGQWDYRKKPIYVLDLREFFELDDQGASSFPEASNAEGAPVEETGKEPLLKSLLVVRIRERLFGLFADSVLQMAPLSAFHKFPNMISTLPKRYFAGVTIINAEIVLILEIEQFITDHELDALPQLTIDK